jgi:DNA-binding LacI/PurR family transcriptional regulator
VAQRIKLLGYQPHAGARALASAKSNVLALVVPLGRDLYVPAICVCYAA